MADIELKPLSTNSIEQIACGIVMPISAIGDCNEGHWSEVYTIIAEAIEPAGFKANMVSGADEVTVIQKTIVQNLYDNPVVIVDVSERNPNVMFELGMRLAFDKPTIIIKDDRTSFVFDTGVIEHLEYPRDLRFSKIIDFKRKLAEKVRATYQKRADDPEYSTFLRHFGQFKLSSIDQKEVSGQDYIISKLDEIERNVTNLTAPLSPSRRPLAYPGGNEVDVCCTGMSAAQMDRLQTLVARNDKTQTVRVVSVGDHEHLYATADFESISERRELEDEFRKLVRMIRTNPKLRMVNKRLEREDRHQQD